MQFSTVSLLALAACAAAFPTGLFSRQSNMTVESTSTCGNQTYSESQYTCYNTNLLCPVVNGTKTIACGSDLKSYHCYLPSEYYCLNATLYQGPSPTGSGSATTATGMARL